MSQIEEMFSGRCYWSAKDALSHCAEAGFSNSKLVHKARIALGIETGRQDPSDPGSPHVWWKPMAAAELHAFLDNSGRRTPAAAGRTELWPPLPALN